MGMNMGILIRPSGRCFHCGEQNTGHLAGRWVRARHGHGHRYLNKAVRSMVPLRRAKRGTPCTYMKSKHGIAFKHLALCSIRALWTFPIGQAVNRAVSHAILRAFSQACQSRYPCRYLAFLLQITPKGKSLCSLRGTKTTQISPISFPNTSLEVPERPQAPYPIFIPRASSLATMTLTVSLSCLLDSLSSATSEIVAKSES